MIGVIADDLTGAAEIGAIGWRHGLRAEIISPGVPWSDVDLLCVDTDSRLLPSEAAAARAALAVNTLHRGGARWIYKKVDSVLRGHVVMETRAMLAQLGRRTALIVPANPGRERVIRQGEYFVGGKPIHETEFGSDPQSPSRSARVRELLGNPDDHAIHVCALDAHGLPSGVVVGEAASAADLEGWAARRSASVLLGGAAEFFEVLLRADLLDARSERKNPGGVATQGPELFVCGTRSESAARFVQTAQAHGVPVFAWPAGGSPDSSEDEATSARLCRRVVDALRGHPSVVLTSMFARAPASARAGEMSERLARLASAAMQQVVVSQVFAEGGATAACLLRELGSHQLSVVGEWAPGVVMLQPGGRKGPRLTLKPGSYTWPDAIQDKLVRGGVRTGGAFHEPLL